MEEKTIFFIHCQNKSEFCIAIQIDRKEKLDKFSPRCIVFIQFTQNCFIKQHFIFLLFYYLLLLPIKWYLLAHYKKSSPLVNLFEHVEIFNKHKGLQKWCFCKYFTSYFPFKVNFRTKKKIVVVLKKWLKCVIEKK